MFGVAEFMNVTPQRVPALSITEDAIVLVSS